MEYGTVASTSAGEIQQAEMNAIERTDFSCIYATGAFQRERSKDSENKCIDVLVPSNLVAVMLA